MEAKAEARVSKLAFDMPGNLHFSWIYRIRKSFTLIVDIANQLLEDPVQNKTKIVKKRIRIAGNI